jgi:hypothetical protein
LLRAWRSPHAVLTLYPRSRGGGRSAFPVCQPPLMWRREGVTRFKGRWHRRDQPSLHSPLPSSSAPAQSLHIPLQHYHHSITPKYPSLTHIHLAFTSHQLHLRLSAPGTQRDARAHAASSASHHHKAGSASIQIALPTTLLSHLHTTPNSVPLNSTFGIICSRAREQAEKFSRTCPRDNKSPYSQQAYRRTEKPPEARRQSGRSWKESAPGMVRRCPAG